VVKFNSVGEISGFNVPLGVPSEIFVDIARRDVEKK
jgi:hypothetical protein